MRNPLLLIAAVALAAACSTPKYTYHFDTFDYNSGKKKQAEPLLVISEEKSPVLLDEHALSASLEATPVILETDAPLAPAEARSAMEKKYRAMTKAEQKEFRKELKKEIKNYVKATKKGENITAASAVKEMDRDLKYAIIFGAVGLTLSLFGGINYVFWVLGVVAVVVAVVFFIKWLVRQ